MGRAALAMFLVLVSNAHAQTDPLLLPKQCRDLLRSVPGRLQIAANWDRNAQTARQGLNREEFCSDTRTALGVLNSMVSDLEACMAKTAADPALTQADIDPLQTLLGKLQAGMDQYRRSDTEFDRACRR